MVSNDRSRKGEEMTEQRFAAWLVDRMGEQNLSASTLARRLSLTPTTVRKWLDGESEPHPINRAALAEALGVTIDELRHAMGDGAE